jgi:hypothetical protein
MYQLTVLGFRPVNMINHFLRHAPVPDSEARRFLRTLYRRMAAVRQTDADRLQRRLNAVLRSQVQGQVRAAYR